MNKKKRIAILFAVILVVAVGIIIAVTSHQKKEMDFDEFADRFEKSAEEVLGEDVKKVTKTELAATLTYGDQTDKDRTIYDLINAPRLSPIFSTFITAQTSKNTVAIVAIPRTTRISKDCHKAFTMQ